MTYIFNRIFTLFFLIFSVFFALTIPVRTALNTELFDFDQTHSFSLQEHNFKIFRTNGLTISNTHGSKNISRAPKQQQYSSLDLHIDFDQDIFLHNYQVISSNYQIQNIENQTYGKFILGNNGIILFPKENSVLNHQNNQLQSFSIGYSLKPYHTGEGTQTIAAYTKNNNIEAPYSFLITIESGIVTYRFENFFEDSEGNPYSITMQELQPLITHKLEEHTIIVDNNKKMIRIYRNGEENAVRILRSDKGWQLRVRQPKNSIYSLSIGKNAIFALESFSIFNDTVPVTNETEKNKHLFWETDVVELSKNTFWLKEINLQSKNLSNKIYKIAYRISTNFFSADTSSEELPWVYIDPNKKQFPPSYSLGRFMQWKFEYFSSYNKKDTFALCDIRTVYKENPQPGLVYINKLTPGDGNIEITWEPLPNDTISGYEIYYGVKPNNYFGTAAISPNSPIYIDTKNSTSQSFSYVLEGLNNNNEYFISIRAKDIYGGYGDYSEEVSEIPSSTKNGLGYSIGR